LIKIGLKIAVVLDDSLCSLTVCAPTLAI